MTQKLCVSVSCVQDVKQYSIPLALFPVYFLHLHYSLYLLTHQAYFPQIWITYRVTLIRTYGWILIALCLIEEVF